jgi:hypothetical protein
MSNPSILMIQERGRHTANWQFRESENFRRSFIKLGVKCEVWGLGQPTFTTSFEEIVKDYDVVFVMENYDQQQWLPDFSKVNKLKVFWSIDSHCVLGQHVFFSKISKFDIHLNSTEGYLKHFARHSPRCVWFPNAYPDDLIDHRPQVQKVHNLGFCGSMISDRVKWLDAISQHIPVHRDVFVIGDAMVDALNSYKIGLNKTLADDVNYRVFETVGAKTLLLSNLVPTIDQLLTPDKHFISYDSLQDLVDKAKYYLEHSDKALEIAEAGYNHVRVHHTYYERTKQLLTVINKGTI